MPSLSGAAALALAATSLFASANAAIDPIVIKGSKFFYKTNGTQFYIKGVAYQQNYDKNTASSTSNVTYSDPLADASSCKRDIPYLQQLQTNTIRVYAVDPTQNHDDCMNAFADAGIYVLADLSAPVEGQSINSNDPSWDLSLYNRFTSVVDVLAKYDNTLGFLAGNEVSDMPNNTNAIAFVAAAVRDTKAYIKSKNYRSIGVGYACTDDGYGGYLETAQYLTCNNQADSIDFFGYNIYSWCGDSSYSMSHYEEHTQQFMNYPVPAFFAEYGCNNVEPRTWGDTQALYGSQMAPVWSGGIVYEYFPGGNNYQLVSVSGNSVTTLTDFSNLKSVMSTISPSGVQEGSYNPTNTGLSSCPTQNSNWTVAPSPLPPSPDAQVCSCMYQSLSCVVSPSVSQDDYGTLFGTVCGLDSSACNGIVHNGTTGKYGAYSPCNATEQLSWALNQYYLKNGQSSSACDFKGAAKVVSGSSNSQCSSITASIGSGGPTGSASGSKGAANRFAASTELGVMPAVVMIVVGVLSGVGMIAL